MKLIESKAELLQQPSGLEGVYKQIEFCGRTCYKSLDKIEEGSARPFVDRMIQSKHTAMLEHGTVYLKAPIEEVSNNFFTKYTMNPYSDAGIYIQYRVAYCYVTTNLRVLVENKWLDDLKYFCEPTEHHERRYTIRFTTDRGVSHELVRHRVFSFAQESTRYCNYSKDKFGNEIQCIIPSWSNNMIEGNSYDWELIQSYNPRQTEELSEPETRLIMSWCYDEAQYMMLLNKGILTAQQARQVLPNALKTEICMTGFVKDWRHFFDLRLFGYTGKPHPDMLLLASKAKEAMMAAKIWHNIEIES